MITWAVLPVKRYSVGKSRLRDLFSETELAELNQQLFESTFTKIQQSIRVDNILVVSREEHALAWCDTHGGVALLEDNPSTLNSAIIQAQKYICRHGNGRIMVLPSDLPLMKTNDIDSLIGLADGKRKLVIVPDHFQSGTNALVMSEPNLIEPCFGTGSFRKHTRQALEKNAELVVYLNENIQWDLDTSLELYRIINTQSELTILSQLRKETIS
jgi:2-phospho-L-lactate guanylyltransferase